jgi:hypothetical protein
VFYYDNMKLLPMQVYVTNRNSYSVAIYVRAAWRKALSTEVTGSVFLSTDWLKEPPVFKVMVLSL